MNVTTFGTVRTPESSQRSRTWDAQEEVKVVVGRGRGRGRRRGGGRQCCNHHHHGHQRKQVRDEKKRRKEKEKAHRVLDGVDGCGKGEPGLARERAGKYVNFKSNRFGLRYGQKRCRMRAKKVSSGSVATFRDRTRDLKIFSLALSQLS